MNVRGDRRRADLLAAAADLLADEGFGALTHRALAARSGVPLASTTHYFRSVDDLAVAATSELARRELARARLLVDALAPRRLSATAAARLVAEVVLGPEPTAAELATFYERYVQAGRVPSVRALVTAWNADLRDLVARALAACGHPLPPARVRLLVGALDGLVVTAVAEGDPDPVASAVPALARLLRDSR